MTEIDQPTRTRELLAGLEAVQERIDRACAAAGRDRGGVSLIVVTKTFPPQDILRLASLGVTDVGENRVQEAAAKAEAGVLEGMRLHLIGQIQTNKAGQVARLADVVHSLDRPKLVHALAGARERTGREPLPVLIQVSLNGDPARGGVVPHDIPALVDQVLAQPALRLAGVMGVPPVGSDPAAAFAHVVQVSEQVRRAAPDASMISAGMSSDLEAAVAAGATHLRVGSAILGSRPSLR